MIQQIYKGRNGLYHFNLWMQMWVKQR